VLGKAALVGGSHDRTKLKARLTCKTGTAPLAHASVYLERKGKRVNHALRSVVLSKARWRTFFVSVRLRAGDRLIVSVPASATTYIPSLTHTLKASKRFASTYRGA